MSKYNGPLFINSHGVRRSSIQAANLVVVMVAIRLGASSLNDQVNLSPGQASPDWNRQIQERSEA